jgi:hypothetical protein
MNTIPEEILVNCVIPNLHIKSYRAFCCCSKYCNTLSSTLILANRPGTILCKVIEMINNTVACYRLEHVEVTADMWDDNLTLWERLDLFYNCNDRSYYDAFFKVDVRVDLSMTNRSKMVYTQDLYGIVRIIDEYYAQDERLSVKCQGHPLRGDYIVSIWVMSDRDPCVSTKMIIDKLEGTLECYLTEKGVY